MLAAAEIRGHPARSLSALARRLNVDRHTLAAALKNTSAQNFSTLRRDAKIETFWRLVEERPHASLKELAELLGFSSRRSMTRFIVQYLGDAPSRLRAVRDQPGIAQGRKDGRGLE